MRNRDGSWRQNINMCGRYTLFDEQDNTEIQSIIREVNGQYPDTPIRTGDIFPTNTVSVIVSNGGALKPVPCVWGFPGYSGNGVIINARAETAAEKKMFSNSLRYRRCVVPSTGFYEWDRQKRKYFFRLPDENMLYMAGLYRDYADGRRLVILTTSANSSMRDVHDRMPVILTRDMVKMWATDTDSSIRYIAGTMPELDRKLAD